MGPLLNLRTSGGTSSLLLSSHYLHCPLHVISQELFLGTLLEGVEAAIWHDTGDMYLSFVISDSFF